MCTTESSLRFDCSYSCAVCCVAPCRPSTLRPTAWSAFSCTQTHWTSTTASCQTRTRRTLTRGTCRPRAWREAAMPPTMETCSLPTWLPRVRKRSTLAPLASTPSDMGQCATMNVSPTEETYRIPEEDIAGIPPIPTQPIGFEDAQALIWFVMRISRG